ncbi:MAG: hypothetical protein H6736_20275 [Alphaproteobacteria bacterium]|nr:hypothetical protein [Alphaproteobacteria bacterium]
MLFDRTCTHTRRVPLGLTHAWLVGGRLYGGLRRFDAWHGVSSWEEGLRWLSSHDRLDEVQYWGHGNWGLARVDRDVLDRSALEPGHALHPLLREVRERMAPGAPWWFRTCDTLGSARGHAFARAWTDFFERPVAGHTHIIGVWQSGLHQLAPGALPHWSESEGIREGTPDAPTRSTWSHPGAPNTIHLLNGVVPAGW